MLQMFATPTALETPPFHISSNCRDFYYKKMVPNVMPNVGPYKRPIPCACIVLVISTNAML